MSIPALDAMGLLPAGVHECTLEEIGDAFGGSSDGHRRDLFKNLVWFAGEAKRLGIGQVLYVDGSYTTGKAHPNDIDIVLVLAPSTPSVDATMKSDEGKRILNPILKDTMHLHVFFEGASAAAIGMANFFQGLRPDEARVRGLSPGHRRGILMVRL